MKRREFINWVGVGFLATSVPVAIAACTPDSSDDAAPNPDTSAATETAPEAADAARREDGFAVVGTVSELDEAGAISDKGFVAGPVAVIRDPADASGILAVNTLCTHQGCTVEWAAAETLFTCPCHGSTFNADGSVATGPATEPLGTYEAKIEGDQVLVSLL
ncbi:MAG: ubiquinol-cytochrome c reductase iron-sulfur subunit [Almyronema sp.]